MAPTHHSTKSIGEQTVAPTRSDDLAAIRAVLLLRLPFVLLTARSHEEHAKAFRPMRVVGKSDHVEEVQEIVMQLGPQRFDHHVVRGRHHSMTVISSPSATRPARSTRAQMPKASGSLVGRSRRSPASSAGGSRAVPTPTGGR